jgi:ankyrin repeat protein
MDIDLSFSIEDVLLDAIENGENLLHVEKMIYGDNYIEINTINDYFETPLILATKCNRYDLVQLILTNNNTSINLQDVYGDTALHVAVRMGYNDIAKLLLNDWRTDINIDNKNRERIIHLVCHKDNIELYELLESYRDLDVYVKDILGYTPFMYSILKLHRTDCTNVSIIISKLLNKGALVEIPDILVDIGDVWKHFIHHQKFDINELINKTENLLCYSCRIDNVELLKILLDKKELIYDTYINALEISITKNNIQICLELFKYYNNNPESEYLCDTLFRYIVDDDKLIELIDKLLITNKINISTILLNCIIHKKLDILWNYEIDINTTDKYNNTLLHLAIIHSSPISAVKKLIRFGINPNCTNKYNKTPLDYALHKEMSEHINLLIPITNILDCHKLMLIDMHVYIKPELLIDIIVDIDYNSDIHTNIYKKIIDFTISLNIINKKRMIIGLLGSTCRYLELLVQHKNISICNSHNTEDISTLETFDISNKLYIIQYGKSINGKYKTITIQTLLGLIKNHKSEYMYDLLDPFDRSNICSSKVYLTNNSILLELLLRLLTVDNKKTYP